MSIEKSNKNNTKNEFYKTNPRSGISLIVLVITIIIIIILAAAVIISIINNNPMIEAREARIKSDVANMQAIFTNAVAKLLVEKQDTIEIEAGQLNAVTSGDKSAVGNAVYKLSDGSAGQIIFDTLNNVEGKYYTGKKLPLYNKETKWYVDKEGIISLQMGDKTYGDGKIVKSIKILTEVIGEEGYIKDKATVKVEIYFEDEVESIKFAGEDVVVPEKVEGKYEVEIEVRENGTYEIEVSGTNGAKNTASVVVDKIENLNRDIDIKSTVTPTEGYVSTNIGLEITYSGEVESIKINSESITVPSKNNGKYTVSKEVLENGEYKVEVKAKDGTINKLIVKVTDITEDMEIWNKADMEKFRNQANSGRTFAGKTVKVMDDIDLEGNESNQWVPIGINSINGSIINENYTFKGTFDGNNHTIEGLYINNSKTHQGLFSVLNKGGNINDLTVKGEISAGAYVSGIATVNYGNISNCTNYCNVTGNGVIGGIAGKNLNNGVISQCGNYGTITGYSDGKFEDQGGIVAVNVGATISSCYNKGVIINNSQNEGYDIGGIAGQNGNSNGTLDKASLIENCYNVGKVSTNELVRVGGITGWNSQNAKVNNCYNTGVVKGGIYSRKYSWNKQYSKCWNSD